MPVSPEATGDVVLRGFLLRVVEDAFRRADLHQMSRFSLGFQVEEGRLVGDPRRLLHVVGDDDDGVVLLEFVDEILHGEGGNRVEG